MTASSPTKDPNDDGPVLEVEDAPVGPALEVEDLRATLKQSNRTTQIVRGVSFSIGRNEVLGLLGESGCGKTTTARAIAHLVPPSGGTVRVDGVDLGSLNRRALRNFRKRLQFIFQDPRSSLNPRRRVRSALRQSLRLRGPDAGGSPSDADVEIDELLQSVGLDPMRVANAYPRELSGGQCQRVAIARALSLRPTLLVCDEPVSALDISVQAKIQNLLEQLRQDGLAMLYISHDLAVVKNVSDRVAVMHAGRICEIGPTEEVLQNPLHPYTSHLVSTARSMTAEDPVHVSVGAAEETVTAEMVQGQSCSYVHTCPLAHDTCRLQEPELQEVRPNHYVACFAISERSE